VRCQVCFALPAREAGCGALLACCTGTSTGRARTICCRRTPRKTQQLGQGFNRCSDVDAALSQNPLTISRFKMQFLFNVFCDGFIRSHLNPRHTTTCLVCHGKWRWGAPARCISHRHLAEAPLIVAWATHGGHGEGSCAGSCRGPLVV
jgi:hypothetical protein